MPRERKFPEHPDFPHSTNAGYRRGCKCTGCMDAHAEDVRTNFLKNHPEPRRPYRKHSGDVNHPDFPHGKQAGYIAGCRCSPCAEARRVAFLAYAREKRVPGTPGGAKKAVSNTVYRKSLKGLLASRKGNATRAARKRGAIIGIGANDQALMRMIYALCPDGYEVDHITPLSKGGMHTPSNLQYLPLSINRQKGGRTDFDVIAHAVLWQDILETPSTIIPQGSRGKRPEVRRTLQIGS